MKRIWTTRLQRLTFCLAVFTVYAASSPIASAALVPSTSDLWDISQGAVITNGSPTEFFSRTRNAIGGDSNDLLPGHSEHFNTIFKDFLPGGTVHSLEWQTAAPVTIRSFALFAKHDGPPNGSLDRAFTEFRLFAFDPITNSFDNLLYDFSPNIPYSGTPTPPGAILELSGNNLSLAASVTATTAQRFRAEFVQTSSQLAPRIIELDGFATPVPEPAAGWLALLAVLGVAIARRRLTVT